LRLAVLFVALIAGTAWLDTTPIHLARNCAAAQVGFWPAPQPPGEPPGEPQGHAHNDYLHRHPLTSALADGFTSVEADVWPVHGELLVAHDRDQVNGARTLDSLYLHPLARAVRARSVPADVQLLVDVKGSPASTLPLLRSELASYSGMLTHYRATGDGCTAAPGPVSVVVSGNAHPVAPDPGTTTLFAYDQPLQPGGHPTVGEAETPLASGDWADFFTWDGHGPMPRREHDRLVGMVAAAHAAGSRIRFWDTPDDPGPARDALWRELAADGVDYVNTNDLAGYAAFRRQSRSRSQSQSAS